MNLQSMRRGGVMALAVLMCDAAAASAAKDRVEVKVQQGSPAIVALTEGGSALAQGAFSSSASIKLQYELVAFNFPTGSTPFGSFSLGLRIVDRSGTGVNSDYDPALALALSQPGGDAPHLQVSPSPSSFTGITGPADPLGSSTVMLTFNCTLANPCPSTDGSEVVANLQVSGTNQLDTSVKVQVRVKLVHPTGDCLRLYNFVTDQDLTTDVTATEVGVVKSGRNAGKVTSTTPFGQLSDNVMAVNLCGATSFDLAITLDASFDTNPNDNPGNAVFTYTTGTVVDPETFNIDTFGTGTPQGQTLCFSNVQLGANETFLTTVHMGIRRGIMQSDLSASPFRFTARLLEPNSSCGGGAELAAATAEVTYTIK